MHRFFIKELENEEKNFLIKEKNFLNQIIKVLRLKKTDKIILFN
jgi:16S rRNA U1498 N3-methylase RsmE